MGKIVNAALSCGLLVMLTFGLFGCATTRQSNKGIDAQQLQVRIDDLEQQLREKDEEIYNLEGELVRAKEAQRANKMVAGNPKNLSRTTKNIQTALKNADFYNGPIDGKIGNRTKKAIRDFQKANGLVSDGVVGKKTWKLLEKYL